MGMKITTQYSEERRQELIAAAIEIMEGGHTSGKAAAHLGVNRGTLEFWLNRAGLISSEMNRRVHVRQVAHARRDIAAGMATRAVCKKYGISPSTIANWVDPSYDDEVKQMEQSDFMNTEVKELTQKPIGENRVTVTPRKKSEPISIKIAPDPTPTPQTPSQGDPIFIAIGPSNVIAVLLDMVAKLTGRVSK